MVVLSKNVVLKQLEEKVGRKVLAFGGALMMVEVHFKTGGVGTVHHHENHEQISYIIKGSFEVEIDGIKQVLKQGDSFHVVKNMPHGVIALEDSLILDVFTPIRQDFLE